MLITPDLLEAAQAHGQAHRKRLPAALEAITGLDAEGVRDALAAYGGYPVARMADLHAWAPAYDVLSFAEALRHECLVFRNTGGALVAVIADPYLPGLQDWLAWRIAEPCVLALSSQPDLLAILSRQEDSMQAMDSVLDPGLTLQQSSQDVTSLSLREINEDASPVIRLAHSTLYDALKAEASDIHLECDGQGLAIKYRIDGVLATISTIPGRELAEKVVSRFKIMADLDIAERRVPQDGRFKSSMNGRDIDFRVSIIPSLHGEDVVLRVLDKQSLASKAQGLRLETLGFSPSELVRIRLLTQAPYGMFLVTGPTGSGKTTTLYAALSEVNHGKDKIITIEDPVEYQVPGILQIPVNEKKGLTFARGLRSILRHDPDKIMVGEIRDQETAQIAIQSALTGHLVFTTVHANNAFDVLGRFINMGVDLYSFVSALSGVLAQRLVRTNCTHCLADYSPTEEELRLSGIPPQDVGHYRFRQGKGCGHCRGTGYRGRKAISELLTLNDDLREMLLNRQPMRDIKAAAQRAGTLLLRHSALELVKAGESTLEEINRVTLTS